MQFPAPILKIIMTYKRDMELLSEIPKPIFCPSISSTPQTIKYLLLQQYTSLLFTEFGSYNLDDYIERYFEVPLQILHDYKEMMRISRERYALWGMPLDNTVSHVKWNETIIRLLSQFLNTDSLLTNINAPF
jgi:hypothetical protein